MSQLSRAEKTADWTVPGAHEVARDVYRIPLPLPQDGLAAINVYALTGDEGLVLVDGGWAISQAREQLELALKSLGYVVGDIRRFLVTHMHRDHYTQAMELRREFGAEVSLGAGEDLALEHARRPEGRMLGPQLEALRSLGAASLFDSVREIAERDGNDDVRNWDDPDVWLQDGDLIPVNDRVLEVVDTPGHTRGHVVFHDLDAQLLFAGDHVLPTITPSLGFEPVPTQNPLGDFLRSLIVVRSRPDAMLLPAHGAVVPSAHRRVDALIDHHGRRLDETEAAVRDGAHTVYQIAEHLYWTSSVRRIDELDPFNQMLAVIETKWHLEMLVVQGRLLQSIEEHFLYYRTAG